MRFRKTLILLAALGGLASCVQTATPDACAGWKPVRVSAASLDHLAAHDPQALAALISHHEFGQSQGCWQ